MPSGTDVVALVLAGGRGSRLEPLTDARPKPAVPFAGTYRLIDITLSNLANSGIRDVWVVEQYRANILNRHLAGGRPWDLDGTRRGLRILPPVEGDLDDGFAKGNGHALFQQLEALEEHGSRTVIVLSADHLYLLDLRQVLAQHWERASDLTIVTTVVDEDPSRYGAVKADDAGRVVDYNYKPSDPDDRVVSTEVLVFEVSALKGAVDALREPGSDGSDLGDYGESIIPHLVEHAVVHEYRMDGYWRDVGTVDAYFRAHMELIEGTGVELNRPGWPIVSNLRAAPPARIDTRATVTDSLISSGATILGEVHHSVIGPGVVVERGATVSRSVLIGDVVVPSGAQLASVIADHGVTIPAAAVGQTKPGPGNITVLVGDTDDEGDSLSAAPPQRL